jgi:3-phenylpropionate/trans-cinnamate dioxygenase ferredoxin subunit
MKKMEVGNIGDIENGDVKELLINGHNILLARVNDRYYAADSRCPHLGGALAQGTLEGTVITCPRHGSQFDLKDGRVVRWLKGSGLVSAVGKALKSPRPLKTYGVTVQGDKILVDI